MPDVLVSLSTGHPTRLVTRNSHIYRRKPDLKVDRLQDLDRFGRGYRFYKGVLGHSLLSAP